MATVTVGQYAVSECKVKVKTSTSSAQTAVYSEIADLEEVSLTLENNTETWYSIKDGGWQNALLTAKALTGSFSGKRTLGDAGNDYLESLRYNIGKSAEADWQIEFPDGSKLEFTAVTALTDILGAATDVAPLSGDLTGKGKPTFTPAS
jgi:hypothetical protein|nr:MAG TPA: major tail protein [Caudoviricetes sp.]